MLQTSLTPRSLVAEALGTFMLVLVGVGASMYGTVYAANHLGRPDGSLVLTTALAFGATYAVARVLFARLTAAHFNPAITLGSALLGYVGWLEAAGLVVAQLFGGVVGAAAVWLTVHGFPGYRSVQHGIGQNTYGGSLHYAWWAAFLLEALLTALLVLVAIRAFAYAGREAGAALVGSVYVVVTLVAVPATGAGLNPARSLGPALFADNSSLGQVWLFILAPLVGGAAAAFTSKGLWGGRVALRLPRFARPSSFSWEHHARPTEDGEPPVIEKDGWRWDYAEQRWVALEQEPDGDTAPPM